MGLFAAGMGPPSKDVKKYYSKFESCNELMPGPTSHPFARSLAL